MAKEKLVHEGPHKYQQAKFKTGTVIYRCGLTNCSHFVPEPMIIGKLSHCWRCPEIFVVTKKTLRSKKFHCPNCTRGRYNQPRKPMLDVDIEKLMSGSGSE